MAKREEKQKEEPGKMTREAGKKGREATEETPGQESYQETGRKGGTARSSTSYPRGAAGTASRSSAGKEFAMGESTMGEASEKGEVDLRLSGNDLEIKFSSQEEAKDWQNRLEQMMKQEGYRLAREKPETMQGESEAAAGE